MQFHVPQFIDVEDKIFGPLTFKQFVYVIGGVGLCVAIYVFVPYRVLALPLIVLAGGLSLALAFYRVNDKPFIYILQAAINYITSSRLYIWKRQEHKEKTTKQLEEEAKQIQKVMSQISETNPSGGKLKDKSFSMDTGSDVPPVAETDPANISPNRSPS